MFVTFTAQVTSNIADFIPQFRDAGLELTKLCWEVTTLRVGLRNVQSEYEKANGAGTSVPSWLAARLKSILKREIEITAPAPVDTTLNELLAGLNASMRQLDEVVRKISRANGKGRRTQNASSESVAEDVQRHQKVSIFLIEPASLTIDRFITLCLDIR
jgi:hypothetical protein